MHGLHTSLDKLRAQIAILENRPVLADPLFLASPTARPDTEENLTNAPGLVHEIFTDTPRNGGAALGFALGQARHLLSPARPVLFFMQLRHEAQEAGLPYGMGLLSFGIDPDSLILCRLADMGEVLWAMEEAATCRAVAAVIADIAGPAKLLDFTASRRLSLRAAGAKTSVFITRYGLEREASAAQMRWHIRPTLSGETMFDARAPGQARWQITMEKGLSQAPGKSWHMGWTQNGFVALDYPHPPGPADDGDAPAAPHGTVSGPLGHRLSQTA